MASSFVFSTVLLALSLSHGVRCQMCVTTQGIEFDNCLEINDMDLFWSAITADTDTVDMLFESSDNGWRALGFSSQRGAGAMIGSNVVFGCLDVVSATIAGADYFLAARSIAGVNPAGNQQLLSYSVNRTEGICSVRFERPVAPEGDDIDILQALNNGASRLVAARGPEGDTTIRQHPSATRAFMDVDFQAESRVVITPPIPTLPETPAPIVITVPTPGPSEVATNITETEPNQTDEPEMPEISCVSVTGLMFDNCVELGDFDVFWNNFSDNDTIEMLYQTPDDGWSALGFSSQRGNLAMATSNVVFGCVDAVTATPAGADYFLSDRNIMGVNQAGRQNLTQYTVTRSDGVCTVQFVRPLAPTNLTSDPDDDLLQALNNGEAARVVFARGGNIIARHTARSFMDIDFAIAQQNDITAPPTTPPTISTVMPAPVGTDGGEVVEDSANALNVKLTIFFTTMLGLAQIS